MKGQITILVLLLGLMGLTVSLSAASRSLSDLKQVSYVDFGTKAFAAAEAGLQYGLNQLSQGIMSPGAVTIDGINVDYEISGGTNNKFSLTGLLKDNVTQVELALPSLPASTKYKVFWNNPASLEISVISKTNSGVYSLRRLAYRGNPDVSGGTFSVPDGSGSSCGDIQHSYINNSYDNCAFFDNSNNPQDQLMRIKAINGATNIEMVLEKPGSQNAILIGAGYTVTATARTNTVTKKVQAVQIRPTMPAIFDYVLFSNSGGISK